VMSAASVERWRPVVRRFSSCDTASSAATSSSRKLATFFDRTAASTPQVQLTPLASSTTYSDEKVANREIRVWHFVIENGY
jgi:hypothetical protein